MGGLSCDETFWATVLCIEEWIHKNLGLFMFPGSMFGSERFGIFIDHSIWIDNGVSKSIMASSSKNFKEFWN